MKDSDPVLVLLDQLCQTRGYRVDKGGPGEKAVAEFVADQLRKHDWLRVEVEDLGQGFYNVLAFDGDPSDVEFLVVGHIDTVTPSPGWTHDEYTTDGTNYYALGSVDTRGGIAAALDAIGKVGRTNKVAYLFYGDEEVSFLGMHEFVRRHPDISPKFGLSVCGGKGEAYLGWRGCTEIEFLFEGVSGHASRSWAGANAAEAVACVMEAVRLACVQYPGEMKTAANIAAVHVGSLDIGSDAYLMGRQLPPPIKNIANKIPNIGWTLLDIRPGDQGVNAKFVERVARNTLAAWNAAKEYSVVLTVHTNFEMPAYVADKQKVDWLFQLFQSVHEGRVSPPGTTGFLDATLISSMHGTQFMCLSPAGDNGHAADEFVNMASVIRYRDAMIELLNRYKT